MSARSLPKWKGSGIVMAMLAATVAAMGVAGPASAATRATGSSFLLYGDQVVPGPADPDGHGDGNVRDFNQKTGLFCYGVTDITAVSEPFTAGYIRQAPPGETGPVVATLFEEPRTSFDLEEGACLTADVQTVKRMDKHPEEFYMELHNGEYPNGAVRGQLAGCLRVC